MDPDLTTSQALEALETRRCTATGAGDTATLTEIYAPDMTFVHFRGKAQTRDDYIAELASKPRAIVFGPMVIKVYGDVALMTGAHDITRKSETGETRLIKTFATRVLHKSGDHWRYVFIQVSPMAV